VNHFQSSVHHRRTVQSTSPISKHEGIPHTIQLQTKKSFAIQFKVHQYITLSLFFFFIQLQFIVLATLIAAAAAAEVYPKPSYPAPAAADYAKPAEEYVSCIIDVRNRRSTF